MSQKQTVALVFLLVGALVSVPAQPACADSGDRSWWANGSGERAAIHARDERVVKHSPPQDSPDRGRRTSKAPVGAGKAGTSSERPKMHLTRVNHIYELPYKVYNDDSGIMDELVGHSRFRKRAEGAAGQPSRQGGAAAEPAVDISQLITREDAQNLLADAGSFEMSPADSWVLVNKPAYFASTARAHEASVEVLGFPVQVHFNPVAYEWNPGDGSASFRTSSSGGLWPDGDVTYTYLKKGNVTPSVTVTWSAQFTAEGQVFDVPGRLQTRVNGTPFEVREARSRILG